MKFQVREFYKHKNWYERFWTRPNSEERIQEERVTGTAMSGSNCGEDGALGNLG